MSLFLNGIETNKVIWNGADTTGYFNGNIVWGYTEPTSGLIYEDATERTTGWVMNSVEVPSGKYIGFYYEHKGSSNNGASISTICFNGSTSTYNWTNWARRHHSGRGNYCIIRYNTNSNIYFTKTNNSVSISTPSDSYAYTTSYNHTSYHKFKLIAEKTTGNCSAFVEGVYMGYGPVNQTNLHSVSVSQGRESSDTPYCKNIKLAWFDNLSDAASWNP